MKISLKICSVIYICLGFNSVSFAQTFIDVGNVVNGVNDNNSGANSAITPTADVDRAVEDFTNINERFVVNNRTLIDSDNPDDNGFFADSITGTNANSDIFLNNLAGTLKVIEGAQGGSASSTDGISLDGGSLNILTVGHDSALAVTEIGDVNIINSDGNG